MKNKHSHAKRITKYIFIGLMALVVFGFILMFLWNWLMPVLFGLPAVNFWQALGLLVLSKILFSGFGRSRRGHYSRHEYWRNKFEEKFEKAAAQSNE